MNRAAPVQLKHKNLVKGSNLTLPYAPEPPGLEFSQDTESTAPTRVTPELELLSRQCQQQLLETTDTVISVHNRSLCLGFLITRLEDRKRTLARVTRLWSALGPCSCLEPTPPSPPTHTPAPCRLFFRHCNANSQSLGPKRGLCFTAPALL